MFALGIVNSVKTEDGGTDYDAPDRLLEIRPGTLSGVDQRSAERDGLLALIRGLVWHRIASLRKRIEATDPTFRLSLQTRNTPQVYDRTGDELTSGSGPPITNGFRAPRGSEISRTPLASSPMP